MNTFVLVCSVSTWILILQWFWFHHLPLQHSTFVERISSRIKDTVSSQVSIKKQHHRSSAGIPGSDICVYYNQSYTQCLTLFSNVKIIPLMNKADYSVSKLLKVLIQVKEQRLVPFIYWSHMLTKYLILQNLQFNAAAKYRKEKNMPQYRQKFASLWGYITKPVILCLLITVLRPWDHLKTPEPQLLACFYY